MRDWTLDDNGNDDYIDVESMLKRWDELDDLRIDVEDTKAAYEQAMTDFNLAMQGDGDPSGELTETRDDALIDLQAAQDAYTDEERAEYEALNAIKDEISGYGGDLQFQGNWYPAQLIDRDVFVDYCEQMVKDIGDLPNDIPGYLAIDWQKTADNLEVDYSTVEIKGREYLYR